MIAKYRLPNGIPLFVHSTDAAPVVSVQAWVSRGSAYESEPVAGISHFLEHALFKGTRKREVGEIALEIETRGGEINAFTSYEETAYYATLASRYFEDGLDVIADAIQYPAFDPAEMAREREVILEEIKRAHDSPGKMVSLNLWSTLFAETPYGRPVLGFERTVSKIGASTLKSYFDRHYHARSISFFVVGDVDPDEAYRLAKSKLSKMRAGQQAKLAPVKARRSTSAQVIPIARDIQQCQVQIGIPTFEITHRNTPAMDLLCSAIGQGESSRLYQRLVKEKRVAWDVSMGMAATNRCGLAALGIVTSPDLLQDAVKEAWNVLWETLDTGLEESEIDRVKNSLEAEVVAGKETVDGYARRLGYYFTHFGDPLYEKRYLDEIFGCGIDETSEVLADLVKHKPVVSLAHPREMKVDKKGIQNAFTRSSTKRPKAVVSTDPVATQGKGVTFIQKKISHLPIVSMKWVFEGGSRMENPSQHGLSALFQRLWTSATRSYSAREFSHLLESLGADISGFAGRNSHGLDVEFLSKQWHVIRPLLAEVLTAPTFPDDEFETEKAILLKEIESQRDTPGQVCHLNFQQAMYGADHPYGRPLSGTLETVSKLKAQDLRDFFKRNVHRGRLVISSVGSFPQADWGKELEPLVDLLPSSPQTAAPLPHVFAPTQPRVVTAVKQPLFQSHILVGFTGAKFDDPERLPLKLLSSCLAGQGGRLFLELRDKQSLAYSVAPLCSDGPIAGIFAFFIGCGPEKLTQSLSGIRREIEKVREKPLPASELKRAKQYWIGRFELDMQRYGAQAALFGLDEFYGLGCRHSLDLPARIRAVTAEEIQRAAQKVLNIDAPTFSIVHNAPLGEEDVLKAWRH